MATAEFRRGEVRTLKYTAPGAIAVNQIVVCGIVDTKKSRVGVARNAIGSGAVGIVGVSGVFTFPKVSGAVIKAGESVNWDASAGAVDDNVATAATGDVAQFGTAMADAGNGETTIDVDIGQPGTYKA